MWEPWRSMMDDGLGNCGGETALRPHANDEWTEGQQYERM
jgi:hypothetical protein